MKCLTAVGLVLGLLVLAAAPACAMTAENLEIDLDAGGNAMITFNYQLTWFEYMAVYLRLVDPAQELKSALESSFGKPVEVLSFSPGSVDLQVQHFAALVHNGNTTTMVTPQVSFAEGEALLKQYWFAPLISPDFSPSETVIRFPDGYSVTFGDALVIPAQRHAI